jgi:ATP synthase protein I
LIRLAAVLSTVGITLVLATVIGLYVGRWIDNRFGTSPWFTALFVLFGLIAGFRNLFRSAKQGQAALDEQNGHNNKDGHIS